MSPPSEIESGDDFAARLAAPTATPGGGAAAARVALFAVSLVRMVAGITLAKLSSDEPHREFERILKTGEALDDGMRQLERDDMAAFEDYLTALRLPRATADERAARQSARQQAALRCAEVPFALLQSIVETESAAGQLRALGQQVRLRAASDLPVAEALAEAAFQAAQHTLEANLGELQPEIAEQFRSQSGQLAARRGR